MTKIKKTLFSGGHAFFLALARLLDAGLGFYLFLLLMHLSGAEQGYVRKIGLVIFGFILLIFHFQGIYRSFRFSTLRYEIRTIFSTCVLLFIILAIMGYTLDVFSLLPKKGLAIWAVCWPVSIALMRLGVRKMLRAIRVKGRNQRSAVIAGQSMAGIELAKHIQRNPWSGTRIMGFFSDSMECDYKTDLGGLSCLGDIKELVGYVKDNDVDFVYIALNGNDEKSMLKLIKAIENLPVTIYCVPNVFFLDLVISGEIIFFDHRPIIELQNTPLEGIPGAAKRCMDIFLSLLLLIPALPLFLVIGILVKFDSPGPVLFIQKRYGINGEGVNVYKFRSMYHEIEAKNSPYVQAIKNDSRVTPVGAFLRRTSLDELPQLFNVIQGRMSLVGPRPHPVAMDEKYRTIISGYMTRHKVRPGITGLAQVNGFRGETEILEKMEKRIACDLRYIREWSLLFDIEILIRTMLVIFFQKNAY